VFVWAFFDSDFCKLAETTNYDFILPSKTYQCHLETRDANFWDLVQSDQSSFRQKPCLSWPIFHGDVHHPQSTSRTSRLC